MNIFDKAIEKISPQTALKRESARWKLRTMRAFQNSGYDESGAARNKNSMRGWLASSKTPQEDIDKNIPVLRQRSRSLFMSAPLAVSAIKTNRTNIVGEGLRLKSTIDADLLGMTMDEAAAWQRAAEREFELWAKSKFCDSTRVNNFYEIQQVACMSWLMNGDACVLLEYEKPTRALPYGLRVHLIESDRVSTPHSTGNNVYLYATDPDTKNRIFNGVEVDSNNRVVAYHICSTYPNSNLYTRKEWKRVKAFGNKTGTPNVLMIYETERAEQYRGVPYLAPVIESLKQLTRYSEAEMMAAVINGFFTVFITSEKGTSETGFTGIVDEEDRVSDDDVNYEIGPGMVNMLGPGEGVEIADAKRPSSNFDAFTTSLAKYVGAALEIPVELLVKNFSSSYSASRAALLEAWKAFRMKRSWMAADFCQPVYEIFLTEAIASGRLKAPGFFLDPLIRAAYCGAQWNGPAQGMIDPVKEVNAAEKRINIGLSTRQRETIEMTGGDFDSNVAQLAREKQLMEAAGIASSGVEKQPESKNPEEIEKESEEETDETKTDDNKSADSGGESEPKTAKFWNFLDNGDTAELQLFGTIQSEESWWDDDCITYRNFINELNALGDKKVINVVIQSGGGDVFAANAIYNALILNKAKITGTIIGICASAATIILMACEERKIAKNAILMAHNPTISLWGSYETEELLKLAEVTNQVKKSIVSAYMERLDKTEEEINRLMDEESWYVGQEAVDAGFCDCVIESDFQNNAVSNNFIVNGVPYSFNNYIENFVPDNIRKKVQDLSKTPQKETGAFFDTTNTIQKGKSTMDEKDKTAPVITDAAALKAAYPQLCAAIAAEAVSAERERLKAIDEISNGIPEELLAKAKYDEPMSAAALALAQMKANNAAGKKFLDQMVDDLQDSGAAAVGSEPNTGYDPEGQKQAENAQKVSGFAAKLKNDSRRR